MFGIEINYLALLVAAILNMILGVLWYGPILGKEWLELTGRSNKDIEDNTKLGTTYGITFVNTLIVSLIVGLAVSLAHAHYFQTVPLTFLDAVFLGKGTGFAIWLIIAATSYTNVLFNKMRKKLWLIGVGYWYFVLVISGLVFALWI